jgi:hypothetical protein
MGNKNSGQPDSGLTDGQRFAKDNIRISPEDLATFDEGSTTPARPTVQPDELHRQPGPRTGVNAETNGPVGKPQTTLLHPNAAHPGFPAGWQSAKAPK